MQHKTQNLNDSSKFASFLNLSNDRTPLQDITHLFRNCQHSCKENDFKEVTKTIKSKESLNNNDNKSKSSKLFPQLMNKNSVRIKLLR